MSNYGTRERPGNSITVIDLSRLTVARTIDLGEYRRPHGMAFFPGDTSLAVTSEVSRAVVLVDFRDGRVIGTVPTNGRASHMLAMSAAGDELFTTNIVDGSISRLDVAKREAKRVIPVAKFVEGIATSPDGKRVWVGIVATAEVPGSPSPEGVTTSPDGRWAFVTLQGRNLVATIDLQNGGIAGYAPTGTWSDGIAYSTLERRP
ncbi:MAG: hypothetical protein DMD26_14275 [Gemmatimonadetes bacterium]|nr:MAG: hypothetical protein DMD26_14275 [Gemmatimonadota bacterium]